MALLRFFSIHTIMQNKKRNRIYSEIHTVTVTNIEIPLRKLFCNFRLSNSAWINPHVTGGHSRDFTAKVASRERQRWDRARGRLVGQVAIKSAGRVSGGREGVAETDFREETAMGARWRPRGLQIRLVSGNACIIGTPTPSTTRPRTSHGQVIMNRGLKPRPRAGRGAVYT